jgi:hypothetical protein
VADDLGRGAAGQQFPEVEHKDFGRQFHDYFKAMFDDDDRKLKLVVNSSD